MSTYLHKCIVLRYTIVSMIDRITTSSIARAACDHYGGADNFRRSHARLFVNEAPWPRDMQTDQAEVRRMPCRLELSFLFTPLQTEGHQGHDYYFRQLRDMKMTVNVVDMPKGRLDRVHQTLWMGPGTGVRPNRRCRTDRRYLGEKDAFDRAIAKFARAYADQTEKDHELFVRAVRKGKFPLSAPRS